MAGHRPGSGAWGAAGAGDTVVAEGAAIGSCGVSPRTAAQVTATLRPMTAATVAAIPAATAVRRWLERGARDAPVAAWPRWIRVRMAARSGW
ncbi:hypothetical protein Phou_078140 [Phytohabitans houttuyneae]|uniref:Uncharacterized protein n=1 Tax=Phytohabitans houttuyneae TaxID=1076126 RepID=A0A6V8KIH0_9ACTN|nr:hypothetical protein Phou_078140 [Phytohabitans houttuyneae]